MSLSDFSEKAIEDGVIDFEEKDETENGEEVDDLTTEEGREKAAEERVEAAEEQKARAGDTFATPTELQGGAGGSGQGLHSGGPADL